MTSLISSPSVTLVNGRPAITSMQVAEYFEKNHQHVLRDIRRIISECEGVSSFGQTTLFEETTYTDEQNGQTYPMFVIYRDGFMLLVMGYTGKKAFQIKLVFIAAFNAMEAELAGRPAPSLDASSRLSTRSDPERKELTAAINAWVGCAPIHYAGARNIVNAHFGVKSVDELTVAQVREAIALVQQRIAEPSKPRQLPLPPAPDLDLTHYFDAMHTHSRRLMNEAGEMMRALQAAYPVNWNKALDHHSPDYAVLPLREMLDDFAGILDSALRAIHNHARAFARVKRM